MTSGFPRTDLEKRKEMMREWKDSEGTPCFPHASVVQCAVVLSGRRGGFSRNL